MALTDKDLTSYLLTDSDWNKIKEIENLLEVNI